MPKFEKKTRQLLVFPPAMATSSSSWRRRTLVRSLTRCTRRIHPSRERRMVASSSAMNASSSYSVSPPPRAMIFLRGGSPGPRARLGVLLLAHRPEAALRGEDLLDLLRHLPLLPQLLQDPLHLELGEL